MVYQYFPVGIFGIAPGPVGLSQAIESSANVLALRKVPHACDGKTRIESPEANDHSDDVIGV